MNTQSNNLFLITNKVPDRDNGGKSRNKNISLALKNKQPPAPINGDIINKKPLVIGDGDIVDKKLLAIGNKKLLAPTNGESANKNY